jgi:hypothetical protein
MEPGEVHIPQAPRARKLALARGMLAVAAAVVGIPGEEADVPVLEVEVEAEVPRTAPAQVHPLALEAQDRLAAAAVLGEEAVGPELGGVVVVEAEVEVLRTVPVQAQAHPLALALALALEAADMLAAEAGDVYLLVVVVLVVEVAAVEVPHLPRPQVARLLRVAEQLAGVVV